MEKAEPDFDYKEKKRKGSRAVEHKPVIADGRERMGWQMSISPEGQGGERERELPIDQKAGAIF